MKTLLFYYDARFSDPTQSPKKLLIFHSPERETFHACIIHRPLEIAYIIFKTFLHPEIYALFAFYPYTYFYVSAGPVQCTRTNLSIFAVNFTFKNIGRWEQIRDIFTFVGIAICVRMSYFRCEFLVSTLFNLGLPFSVSGGINQIFSRI